MKQLSGKIIALKPRHAVKMLISVTTMMLIAFFNISATAQTPISAPAKQRAILMSDSIVIDTAMPERMHLPISKMPHKPGERPHFTRLDTTATTTDTTAVVTGDSLARQVATVADTLKFNDDWQERATTFVPNPTRAVWLSALFPGLGQIYNRRYWKLPIVVGAYMGLGYATSWNNRMLDDYTRAYRDIMDTDPSTKSYMEFFPPTTKEEDLDKSWLTNTLKSRKNYFRQNRDLCIICMVGVYLLAMVDAYVDASLSQFDLSPDLSMQVAPALIQDTRHKLPAVGVHWAFCF